MKFQFYLIFILALLFSLNSYSQCPTVVTTDIGIIEGPFCEGDIFDFNDLNINVETDDDANATLTWFLDDGTPIADPSNFEMNIGMDLCQPTIIVFELKVTCPNDPTLMLDAGIFTASIYPENSLQVCTPTITTNDQCDPVIDLLCPNCDLIVEYSQDGVNWSTTPPSLVSGSMGNAIPYRVFLNGSPACFFLGALTVDCPDECPNMILIPPGGIGNQGGTHCSGEIMDLESLQVGQADLDMPAFSVAVWKDPNGNVIDDPAAVPMLHSGATCSPEIQTYTLEFDCTLDENLDIPAGVYEAQVFPNLNDLITLPTGCQTEITTSCPAGVIDIQYSVSGAAFSPTPPPTLQANDPPLTVDYQVSVLTAVILCDISGSFTANCANTGMCPMNITPLNQDFPAFCNSLGFSLDGLNSNTTIDPNAVFIWTDESGAVVTDNNGNAEITYSGDGCSPQSLTWDLEIGCVNDPAFSADGGNLNIIVFPNIDENNIVLPDFCDTEISYNCASLQDIIIEYSTDGINFTNTAPPGLNEGDPDFELFYKIYVVGAPSGNNPCTYENSIIVSCPVDIPDCGSAGTGSSQMICSDGSIINLFDLLDGEDSDGFWSETSIVPSTNQAFDFILGTFNTSGQLPQVYEFEYKIVIQDCPVETATINIELIEGANVSVVSEATVCNDGGDPSSIDFADLVLLDEGNNFWSDNNGMNLVFDSDSSSVIDFTGFTAGDYEFIYASNDSSLCVGEGQSTIVTVENCLGKVIVPTAFSPNNDGVNDFLKLVNTEGVESVEFKVFNRWGQMVFNAIDVNDGWDGNFKRQPQGIGVYVFFAEVVYKTMEVETVSGSVTLIR